MVCECERVCLCVCVCVVGMGVGGGVGDHQDQDQDGRDRRQETGRAARGRGWKIVSSGTHYMYYSRWPWLSNTAAALPHARSPRVLGSGDWVDSWQRQIHPGKGSEGDGSWALAAAGLLCGSRREKKRSSAFPLPVSRPPPAQHRQGGARLESWTGLSEQAGAYTAPFPPNCRMYFVLYHYRLRSIEYSIQNTAMYTYSVFPSSKICAPPVPDPPDSRTCEGRDC